MTSQGVICIRSYERHISKSHFFPYKCRRSNFFTPFVHYSIHMKTCPQFAQLKICNTVSKQNRKPKSFPSYSLFRKHDSIMTCNNHQAGRLTLFFGYSHTYVNADGLGPVKQMVLEHSIIWMYVPTCRILK